MNAQLTLTQFDAAFAPAPRERRHDAPESAPAESHVELHGDANRETPAASAFWREPAKPTASHGAKAVAVAGVVLFHVVIVGFLSHINPELSERREQPLQVISIEAPQDVQSAPPPPKPQAIVPVVFVPVPEINVAPVENNAITVRAANTAPPAAESSGTPAPKVVSTVEYVREPVAKYPAAARALKQRGIVMVRALIDVTGQAREANVHRSSGYRILDDAAKTAVLNALFKPYIENGRSLPVYVLIPIEFGAS